MQPALSVDFPSWFPNVPCLVTGTYTHLSAPGYKKLLDPPHPILFFLPSSPPSSYFLLFLILFEQFDSLIFLVLYYKYHKPHKATQRLFTLVLPSTFRSSLVCQVSIRTLWALAGLYATIPPVSIRGSPIKHSPWLWIFYFSPRHLDHITSTSYRSLEASSSPSSEPTNFAQPSQVQRPTPPGESRTSIHPLSPPWKLTGPKHITYPP
jgi:hypothetical protein